MDTIGFATWTARTTLERNVVWTAFGFATCSVRSTASDFEKSIVRSTLRRSVVQTPPGFEKSSVCLMSRRTNAFGFRKFESKSKRSVVRTPSSFRIIKRPFVDVWF